MKNSLENFLSESQFVSQEIDNEKIEKIKSKIEQFKEKISFFKKKDKMKIEEALNLMLEIHINQKDRQDGMPYIGHPLEIADDVINRFNIKDVDLINAALLHDSVEDQSLILSQKYLSKHYPQEQWAELLNNKNNIEKEYSAELREIALLEINENFGLKTKNIVNSLSNPDFSKLIDEFKLQGIEKTKHNLYKEHVAEAVINPDVCVIKYADFARNALKIHNIEEGKRKNYLQKKYGPVIKDVFLPLFKDIDDTHPLYSKKEDVITELEEYYKENY